MNKNIVNIRDYLVRYLNEEKLSYEKRYSYMQNFNDELYVKGLNDGIYIIFRLITEVLDGQ